MSDTRSIKQFTGNVDILTHKIDSTQNANVIKEFASTYTGRSLGRLSQGKNPKEGSTISKSSKSLKYRNESYSTLNDLQAPRLSSLKLDLPELPPNFRSKKLQQEAALQNIEKFRQNRRSTKTNPALKQSFNSIASTIRRRDLKYTLEKRARPISENYEPLKMTMSDFLDAECKSIKTESNFNYDGIVSEINGPNSHSKITPVQIAQGKMMQSVDHFMNPQFEGSVKNLSEVETGTNKETNATSSYPGSKEFQFSSCDNSVATLNLNAQESQPPKIKGGSLYVGTVSRKSQSSKHDSKKRGGSVNVTCGQTLGINPDNFYV